MSLDLGIGRLSNLPTIAQPDPIDEFEVPAELKRQIRSQAVEWVAGLLLHEIASPIGLVKTWASREIPDYEHSNTKYHLENVQKTFEAIEQLKGAAAIPKPELFDLAEMMSNIVAEELADRHNIVSLIGPKPLMVRSDPALVRLAVCNGIRNALEAVATANRTETHPVIITWGETDVDYWVSVLDRGVGIVGPVEAAFEIGKSTKQGHSGFGLSIARQAIETLGGTVRLTPGADGGARYEARWER
jgi:signal transduction histidine kinase